MRESHANKSVSFLMELIFVLFFFTIASAICVFVLGKAKDKNDIAADTRNALQYGDRLLSAGWNRLSAVVSECGYRAL